MATYDADPDPGETLVTADPSLVTYTHIMYALHMLAVVIGVFTAASIIGMFLFSLPSIIAVVMNYLRRSEARGTWLESHFRWQLRTFWFAALWVVASCLAFGLLIVILVGYVLILIALAIIGVWVAYRMIRGWLALRDHRPAPL